MAAPVVTYWNSNSSTNITSTGWKIGEIDAGTESAHFTFNIWNNKGGSSATSTMKNVTLHVLNSDGSENNTSLLGNAMVTGKWCRVKVNGGSVVQIGGSASTNLRAKGLSSGNTIEGGVNGDTKNYAQIEAYVSVPSGATEGTYSFIFRTKYQYT